MPTNATDVIITAAEVLEVTPRAQGNDPQMITPLIPIKEESLFRVWLGLDFYDDLLGDLSDHSGFTNFIEGNSYTTGQTVLWRDKLFTATGDTGGAKPSDSSVWAAATKFDTEANEYLWNRYLKTILAWHIFQSGFIYQAVRVGELGVTRQGGRDGSETRPASIKELSAFKSEVGHDLNDFLQTMDRYLRTNKTTFPNYLPNKHSSTSTDGTSRRAVGRPRPNHGFSF